MKSKGIPKIIGGNTNLGTRIREQKLRIFKGNKRGRENIGGRENMVGWKERNVREK